MKMMWKRVVVFSLLTFLLVFGAFILFQHGGQHLREQKTKTVMVNDSVFQVYVADTPEERSKGLMGVEKLGKYEGMLFVFEDAREATFWNKDTLIPLDVVWMRDGIVQGVERLPAQDEKGIVSITSSEPVDTVLEMKSGAAMGRDIHTGDEVIIQ